MLRSIVAAAATAAAILAATGAAAQSCTQIPVAQTCVQRGVPIIDRRVPGVGGDVVCKSYSGAPQPVQYDTYIVQWGFTFYSCTRFQSCSWAQANDQQAWNAFCK